MDIKNFIKNNKNKINVLTERNSTKNFDGKVVIGKRDPWYKEDEWEEVYKKMKEQGNICK